VDCRDTNANPKPNNPTPIRIGLLIYAIRNNEALPKSPARSKKRFLNFALSSGAFRPPITVATPNNVNINPTDSTVYPVRVSTSFPE